MSFKVYFPEEELVKVLNDKGVRKLKIRYKKNSLLVFVFFILTIGAQAQNDSTFQPSGKVILQVIDQTLYETDGTTEKYGMYINRAFLGYRYTFHPNWAGAVVIDAGRPTVFGNLNVKDTSGNTLPVSYDYSEGSYYTIMLKFAYLEFNPNSKLKFQAGGILQNHYITQEKFWGYRYILETFQDRYYRIPSSDLGFIAYYSPMEWLSVDAAITNGEGMRINQESFGNVKYAVGVDVKPVKGWVNRIFYDAVPSDRKRVLYLSVWRVFSTEFRCTIQIKQAHQLFGKSQIRMAWKGYPGEQ